ncbi:MAG: GNAT family N-acetyltransferase [Bryobacteraceae bacterium]
MTPSLIAAHSPEPGAVPPLDTMVVPAAPWSSIAPIWTELAETSQSSIFMSPLWVETWLETFGDLVKASLVTFQNDRSSVGTCLIVEPRRSWKRPLRRITINASGEPDEDTLYIEFNSLLCREEWIDSAVSALAACVRGRSWDEFELNGFCPGPAYDLLKRELSDLGVEESWQPCYYVDLAGLRNSGLSYIQALGAGHRQYLRRKMRYYSPAGELRLELASNTSQALAMLGELAWLNTRRFKGLGRRGLWQSARFGAFHSRFVEKGFPLGKVQLLRVTAGQELVGIVYNLVHANKVYFYQCGYNYTSDKRLSPGVVTLALAIEHALMLGFDEFDFLAGDASYKEWMSTGSRRLVWATFRRPSPRVWAHSRLRALKNRIVR